MPKPACASELVAEFGENFRSFSSQLGRRLGPVSDRMLPVAVPRCAAAAARLSATETVKATAEVYVRQPPQGGWHDKFIVANGVHVRYGLGVIVSGILTVAAELVHVELNICSD